MRVMYVRERNKEGRTPKLPTENHMITQRKVTSTDPARRSYSTGLRSPERRARSVVPRASLPTRDSSDTQTSSSTVYERGTP